MPTETSDNAGRRRKTVISLAVGVVVVVVVFGVIFPQLIDWDAVFDVLGQVESGDLVVLVVLGTILYVPSGWIYSLVLPGLRLTQGIQAWLGTSALSSSTPGFDIPLRYAMYNSWGFSIERTTSGAFLSGIVEMTTKYVIAIIAVGVFAIATLEPTLLVMVAIAAAIVSAIAAFIWLVLRSETGARRLGERIDQTATWAFARANREAPDDIVDRILNVRLEARDVLGQRWPHAFLAASTAQALSVLILITALRAVGLDADTLSWADILLAYGIHIILTTIPITPGNVGISELVYVTTFTILAGSEFSEQITAGVLLFRLATWLLTIIIGWLVVLRWQQSTGFSITNPNPTNSS